MPTSLCNPYCSSVSCSVRAHMCVHLGVASCLGQLLGHVHFFPSRPIISRFKEIPLSDASQERQTHQRELQKQGGRNKTQDQLTLDVSLLVHGEGHSPHGEINTVNTFLEQNLSSTFPAEWAAGLRKFLGLVFELSSWVTWSSGGYDSLLCARVLALHIRCVAVMSCPFRTRSWMSKWGRVTLI